MARGQNVPTLVTTVANYQVVDELFDAVGALTNYSNEPDTVAQKGFDELIEAWWYPRPAIQNHLGLVWHSARG